MQRYEKIRRIGKGSFGTVYLYLDTQHPQYAKIKSYMGCGAESGPPPMSSSGAYVVVKEIDMSGLSAKERSDVRNEATVLRQLSHPNIIKYHAFFEENHTMYIVMDYADGGDLFQLIKQRNGAYFTEEEILDWFVQMCLALKHVHDKRILHRDLKTQNVFLTRSKLVKLGDFGIARILKSTMDCAKTAIGTPYYLSPEICEDKPYNHKSDVWSLGCVLYEMCTLKHAFDAQNMRMLIVKILRGSYPPIPTNYSKDLRELVSCMLKRSPSQRPSVNAILSKDFIKNRISHFLSQTTIIREFGRGREGNSAPDPSKPKAPSFSVSKPLEKQPTSISHASYAHQHQTSPRQHPPVVSSASPRQLPPPIASPPRLGPTPTQEPRPLQHMSSLTPTVNSHIEAPELKLLDLERKKRDREEREIVKPDITKESARDPAVVKEPTRDPPAKRESIKSDSERLELERKKKSEEQTRPSYLQMQSEANRMKNIEGLFYDSHRSHVASVTNDASTEVELKRRETELAQVTHENALINRKITERVKKSGNDQGVQVRFAEPQFIISPQQQINPPISPPLDLPPKTTVHRQGPSQVEHRRRPDTEHQDSALMPQSRAPTNILSQPQSHHQSEAKRKLEEERLEALARARKENYAERLALAAKNKPELIGAPSSETPEPTHTSSNTPALLLSRQQQQILSQSPSHHPEGVPVLEVHATLQQEHPRTIHKSDPVRQKPRLSLDSQRDARNSEQSHDLPPDLRKAQEDKKVIKMQADEAHKAHLQRIKEARARGSGLDVKKLHTQSTINADTPLTQPTDSITKLPPNVQTPTDFKVGTPSNRPTEPVTAVSSPAKHTPKKLHREDIVFEIFEPKNPRPPPQVTNNSHSQPHDVKLINQPVSSGLDIDNTPAKSVSPLLENHLPAPSPVQQTQPQPQPQPPTQTPQLPASLQPQQVDPQISIDQAQITPQNSLLVNENEAQDEAEDSYDKDIQDLIQECHAALLITDTESPWTPRPATATASTLPSGIVVEGVTEKDTMAYRIEMLRMQLEDSMGFDEFIRAYQLIKAGSGGEDSSINNPPPPTMEPPPPPPSGSDITKPNTTAPSNPASSNSDNNPGTNTTTAAITSSSSSSSPPQPAHSMSVSTTGSNNTSPSLSPQATTVNVGEEWDPPTIEKLIHLIHCESALFDNY